jgi:hypothetical protein
MPTLETHKRVKLLDRFKVVSGSPISYDFEFDFDGDVTSVTLQGFVEYDSGSPTTTLRLDESSLNGVTFGTGDSFAIGTATTVTTTGVGRYRLHLGEAGNPGHATYTVWVIGH